jgi:hypothetical protein
MAPARFHCRILNANRCHSLWYFIEIVKPRHCCLEGQLYWWLSEKRFVFYLNSNLFARWWNIRNVVQSECMIAMLLFLNFFVFLFFYYCWTGGMLWHLQKLLQYILVEFTPFISFISLPALCSCVRVHVRVYREEHLIIKHVLLIVLTF